MANVIKIKKGLDINLKGKPSDVLLAGKKSVTYAIVPDNYNGIIPKVVAKAGDKVKAGSVLMYDKNRPEIKFVSPVSGEVLAVNRGAKRKVLSIEVQADAEVEYVEFGKKNVSSLKAEEIKEAILEAGLWPSVRQRPYDIVATPGDAPRDIFVSAFYSAPLAPNFDFILRGQEVDFQTGLDALAKLTSGKVYVGVRKGSNVSPKGVELIEVEGPHPAANVGVQINYIKPINKGEIVWVVNPDEVIMIGRLFNKGIADFSRMVVLTGSEISEKGYVETIAGCSIKSLVDGRVQQSNFQNGFQGLSDTRIISGNVLSGTKVDRDGYLGAYDNQITVIPEGEDVYELFGWIMPRFNDFSVSRTYFSWLMGKKKEYTIDARIKGGKRAMIMSNEYDQVFPMNILPEYLLKAIIAFDIDKMENLGIYEVAPEDFALCEFVDTSKIEIQKIVRDGLDLLYKEMN
ncbi:Na(+)-translocating NADH-quinone reductase subunit A [Parabacteroides sp. PF5-9]|uniref:Na(+)-translocating NADH-quinone reductase subunit A n=1 Tax=Parabacteroides sp. PF5-9 TaxID=1742404 RepID=UPI002474B5E7|nr:Na(+)-translocating NADH-quinone reductase subunit A [Parabacteroides sp. PF5-9]